VFSLDEMQNIHLGEDVYVLGSGATLDYVDPYFFDGKITVSTNLVGALLGIRGTTAYTHSHYHVNALEVAEKHPESIVVAPMGDRGYAGKPKHFPMNVVYYEHVATGQEFDVNRSWHESGLIVGSSSIHGSIHLAAHMGARNIILVGADCGYLDGKTNHSKYMNEFGGTQSGDLLNDTAHHLARWDKDLRMVKEKMIEVYGVRMYSLNPFVNLRLEDHVFTTI
jgi:hypothetical protein